MVCMQRILLPSLCASRCIATSLFLYPKLGMASDKLLQSLESLRGQRCMWRLAFEISWAYLVPSQLVHLVSHQFFKTLSLRSCCWQNMNTVHFFQSSSALLHSSLLVIFPNWAYWVKTEINNMMDGWRGEDRCGSQDKGLLSEIPWINPLPGIFFSRKFTL